MVFPILRSNPDFEVGIPVSRAMLRFTFVMPNALFHEKDSPGIPRCIFFLAILCYFEKYGHALNQNQAYPYIILFSCY